MATKWSNVNAVGFIISKQSLSSLTQRAKQDEGDSPTFKMQMLIVFQIYLLISN
jgi:hypothetical protein